MADYIFQLNNVCKNYGVVKALKNISINIERGKVHALLGENGAGKSTLIRSLSCVEEPTSGEILYNGKSIVGLNPREAHELGISTVYQEPSQALDLSVMENLFMDRQEKNGLGLLDNAKTKKKALELMDETGIHLDPLMKVRKLSTAQRQMLEILKAMSYKSKFIIFDEPTSSLTTEETTKLFEIINSLKKNGVTVLYISHRMQEIFEICDHVFIFRDGGFVCEGNINEFDNDSLIRNMVGRDLSERFYKKEVEIGENVLEVKNLSNSKVRDVSFYLKKGEVLGFSGLVGAGRTETMNSLFGLDSYSGSIIIEGKEEYIDNPIKAMNLGISLVPEDRKVEGVVPIMSIKNNITLPNLNGVKNKLLLSDKKQKALSNKMIDRLRIKAPSGEQLVKNLSGGNQQKVVFAKWLASNPKIMILDEPTRGIDVGAKAEIYHIIGDLVESGISVIVISSEMPELISLSDRIYCMRDGKIVSELQRKDFSEERILNNIFGE